MFENCAYVTDWGYAPIQVSPSAKKLSVCNNEFRIFDDRLLYARNIEWIEWIEWIGNKVEKTDAFKGIEGKSFDVENVGNFTQD